MLVYRVMNHCIAVSPPASSRLFEGYNAAPSADVKAPGPTFCRKYYVQGCSLAESESIKWLFSALQQLCLVSLLYLCLASLCWFKASNVLRQSRTWCKVHLLDISRGFCDIKIFLLVFRMEVRMIWKLFRLPQYYAGVDELILCVRNILSTRESVKALMSR